MKNFKEIFNHVLILPILITFIIILNIFFGETIPINYGKGWDGEYYFQLAHDYDISQFFNGNKINSYYMHRILPWLTINILNKIIQNRDTHTTFIIAKFLMTFCIILGIYFTRKIGDFLKFNKSQNNILFVFIFINASVLKISGYYVFLTEYYALTLILASTYFFLNQSVYKLILVTFLLNFTWPFLIINYYFIYVLLSKKDLLQSVNYQVNINTRILTSLPKFTTTISILRVLIVGSLAVGLIYNSLNVANGPVNGERNLLRIDSNYYILGALTNLTFFVLFFNQMGLIVQEYLLLKCREKIHIKIKHIISIILILVIFITLKSISNIFSNPSLSNPSSALIFLKYRILRLSSLPLDIVLSSIAYIGFALPFAILYWKNLKDKLLSLDFLGILISLLCLTMLLNGETRMNIVIWPILSICMIKFTPIRSFSNIYPLIIVAFIVSRFYLDFNAFELAQNSKSFVNFPNQGYFMYFSPWLSWKGWIAIALIGLITAVTAIFTKSRNKTV